MGYNPKPPRVWSRVQNICSLNTNTNVLEDSAKKQMMYKANILQYKNNSLNISKLKRTSRIYQGINSSRKKSYAIQSDYYSNSNTSGLQRVNYTVYTYPNNIPGQPNNDTGPYQTKLPNPDKCNTYDIIDGGTLICGTRANPCNPSDIKKNKQNTSVSCFPTYCSDVPGKHQLLCRNNNIQLYFPKKKYTMGTSNNKWPQGYKGLVSACNE